MISLQWCKILWCVLINTNISDNTEDHELSKCQLCHHWWYLRLSESHPAVIPVMTNLPSWQFSVLGETILVKNIQLLYKIVPKYYIQTTGVPHYYGMEWNCIMNIQNCTWLIMEWVVINWRSINSFCPSDTIQHSRIWPQLAQLMACPCLVSSPSLSQWWLIVN